MIIQLFMRKPFFVSAVQVTLENMGELAKWCGGYVVRETERPFVFVPVDRATSRRQSEAYVGMYVVRSKRYMSYTFKVYGSGPMDKDFYMIDDDSRDTIAHPNCKCGAPSATPENGNQPGNSSPHFRAPASS